MKNLDDYKIEIETNLEDYKRMEIVSKGFDFPDETVGCSKILETIQSEYNVVKDLWDIIKADLEKFETFYKIPWSEVNGGNMEDEIRALQKTLG
jgi:dynein heavy chain